MTDLHVINSRTGQPTEPPMLSLLCDGDASAYLTDCGLDLRPYFAVSPSVPAPFRVVSPEHGRFPATLYRPTRRERIAGWWACHRWPLLRGALLTLSFLAAYVALNLIITGLLAVVDRMSGGVR
jgi:hypothetical protein